MLTTRRCPKPCGHCCAGLPPPHKAGEWKSAKLSEHFTSLLKKLFNACDLCPAWQTGDHDQPTVANKILCSRRQMSFPRRTASSGSCRTCSSPVKFPAVELTAVL